jgi:hypothetical protein
VLPKSSLLWVFETSFIEGLPWDSGKWHWQGTPPTGGLALLWELN